ncbi:MAG: ribonuclease HI family protein [Candidatus Gracilibacteria bacterium]|nr:ribonuclease HI family protein [Candidatus Gracilibacteria bacterium]
MKLKVYTDGGSRGNPGIAGLGVYITDFFDKKVEQRYKHLGEKTNNEAEYLGAYYGIKRAIELGASEIELYMDSNLVIKQLSGEWKIKKEQLRKINEDIISEIKKANVKIKYNWIPREDNKEADRLSNVAMDNPS